jgi:hypothetical protein
VTLDIAIGDDDNDRLLSYFNGASPELGIVSIESNVNSEGRILMLRNGAAVNQVRRGGKWIAVAFAGDVPEAIADRIEDES